MNKYREERYQMSKRSGVIIGMLCAALAAATPVLAEDQAAEGNSAGTSVESAVELPDGLEPDMEDPDYVKRFIVQDQGEAEEETGGVMTIRSATAFKTKSPFTGLTYTHAAKLNGYKIVDGIDVSKWQAKIDWEKVKKAGVEYAFIRCGYTSLGKSFSMLEDSYFEQNIKNAYDAGIKVGVYFFSNSMSVSEAKQEAKKTISLLKPYKNMITMPVVYDFEAFNTSYRAYGLSTKQITDNALAFMGLIQDEGYTPMYYGSPAFMEVFFDLSRVGSYNCWLANYTTKTSYTGDYDFWQYSSTGSVAGISGNVDCNFQYIKQKDNEDADAPDADENADGHNADGDAGGPKQVTGLKMYKNSSTAVRISWNPVNGADGYKIYRSDVYGGSYKLVATIPDGDTVTWRNGDFPITAGKQYYYKVAAFTVDGDQTLYGKESDILTAYLKQVYTYKLRTNVSLNLREQAGTEYGIVTALPAGTVLTYPKYTYSADGNKWYKVSYKANGKSYAGYLSGRYVTTYTYAKTKVKLPLRDSASMSADKVTTLPADLQVTICGSTTDATGRSWNYVQCKKNGKTYRGYILTKNLNRI